jgi:hypothetical protein
LQLWVTVAGLAILEQRAPYAHHLRGSGLYHGRLRKLRECGAFYPVTPKMNRATFNEPEAIAPLEPALE